MRRRAPDQLSEAHSQVSWLSTLNDKKVAESPRRIYFYYFRLFDEMPLQRLWVVCPRMQP